ARDQAAHTVRDDVDPQRRVGVVAANRFDQAIEPARRFDVVLPPVVRKDVVAARAPRSRRTGCSGHITAEAAQGVDNLAIEVAAQRRFGDAIGFELVAPDLQRDGVEVERDIPVLAEYDVVRRAWPDFDAANPVAQPRAEYARNDDDRRRIDVADPVE